MTARDVNGRCAVIADVAQSHEGSVGQAHAFIDAVADAGADGVKFQTHIAAAESTPHEPWRIRFSDQDASRYDYWRRMEFTETQWAGLREHAEKRGLSFISSAFSDEAVALLERVGVDAWKIASGEVSDVRLIDRMAATGTPVILSTGMSALAEIDDLVERIRAHGVDLTVLQCTSMYPTPAEKVGLNIIDEFRRRYGCKVGLSDHSGRPFAGIAAAALGIDMLEVHITLSRHMFGPDVSSSLTPEELRSVVEGVRFVEAARAHPVDKDAVSAELREVRDVFAKSIVARTDLAAGTVLEERHLAAKKPGTGLPPSMLPDLIGRRLARAVAADQLLEESDLA